MPQDIVKVESLPERQVYWLIQEGGRILGGELEQIAQTGLLRELLLSCRERRKHAWLLFQSATMEVVKASMLKQLMAEDQHMIDLAERMKVLEPKPTYVQHSGKVDTTPTQIIIIRDKRAVEEDAVASGNGNGNPAAILPR